MTEESEYVRVNMDWPRGLKEEIRGKVGPRGLTEFTLDAVRIHLTQDGYAGVAEDLRMAKQLAQRLANVMATTPDSAARMQFLLNAEFPDWIDMSSWPAELVRRANEEVTHEITDRPEPAPVVEEPRPVPPADPDMPQTVGEIVIHRLEEPRAPEPEPEVPAIVAAITEEAPAPVAVSEDRNDLFARLKGSGALTSASSLPKPDPKPVEPEPEPEPESEPTVPPVPERDIRADVESPPTLAGQPNPFAPVDATGPDPFPAAVDPNACPNGCGELIGGECWTCGYVRSA